MKLHSRGWQVHRAYIDSHTDFVLSKYWCKNCNSYQQLEKRKKPRGGDFPTDCCATCLSPSLYSVIRFVQAKTSEGIPFKNDIGVRKYSFHAKLRSNVDPRAFYVWIALVPAPIEGQEFFQHFFVFHHSEIARFDNLNLDSYQTTDNQKITLTIDREGNVLNQGRVHDFSCFQEFYNNFEVLDQSISLGTSNG